ncbi:Na(+)-translocating NADH-quinone reductase subunit C [Polaribacter sp. MSW13]|uniref:Na(+)-translocating NADH-quinone reductase subunit C n=1 Tax=Polaribacter marinus TaxID=2916838 RepID=A0A9X2AIV2_9FLAO|nr:Na(+)-translocating NADH-quinone reductase subunit C [Polaribacter marinus]MCI2228896.1 Na(+)-translocating NADH-quinone reductase subunit C [Polaribacter marinus]
MSKRTDSNVYTIVFAVVMVLVVGTLLATVFSLTKPTITTNQKIEKQQNILYAMGVNDNDETSANFVSTKVAQEEFSKYIKKQLVIEGDKVTENDKAYLIDVKKEQSKAKEGKTRRLALFIGEKDGKTFYVAPIRGKGLWDAIWGYVSMDKNMIVQGAYFDHKGETPGLGANIKQRFFMDDFIGEHLLDDKGNFAGITVAKGNNDPKNEDKIDNEVDAIAGATITGNGVSAMIKSDLKLYIPYFKTLKK